MLQESDFAFQMRLKPAQTYTEYIARARHYANALVTQVPPAEKAKQEKKRKQHDEPSSRDAHGPEKRRNRDGVDRPREDRNHDRGPRVPTYPTYQALNATIEEIYVKTQNRVNYRPPRPIDGDPARRNPNKYFRYHQAQGQTTNECWDLKDEVEALL